MRWFVSENEISEKNAISLCGHFVFYSSKLAGDKGFVSENENVMRGFSIIEIMMPC